MQNFYVYEWLDKLSNHDLNPANVHPGRLTKEEAGYLEVSIVQGAEQVEYSLKELFFKERDRDKLYLLVHKYHDMLIVMMNKVHEHLSHAHVQPTGLNGLLHLLLNRLEGLLQFFEVHFFSFIGKQLHLPQTRLEIMKRDLEDKRDYIKRALEMRGAGPEAIGVVLEAMEILTRRISQRQLIKIWEVDYHRHIIADIERNAVAETVNSYPLEEMLIIWNLNSESSIGFFTKRFENELAEMGTVEEKLELLRKEYKALQQLPEIPNLIYNKNYPGIKDYLSEYLSNEMRHLEQKINGFKPLDGKEPAVPPFKVLCTLSTDQIGLILRAADESRILIARSLNSVFRAIVPFLSTQKKTDPSWKSMRTKSYEGEQRDKDIAIDALQEMIKRIKEY